MVDINADITACVSNIGYVISACLLRHFFVNNSSTSSSEIICNLLQVVFGIVNGLEGIIAGLFDTISGVLNAVGYVELLLNIGISLNV